MNLKKNALLLIGLSIFTIAMIGFTMKRRLEREGLIVTSWFRSPLKNKKVGGVINSKHQYFMAIDVVPANQNSVDIMKRLGFKKVINEGDHVHGEFI